MEPARLALLGTGGVARAHLTAAVGLGLAPALCDVDQVRAESLRRDMSSDSCVFRDVGRMLAEFAPRFVIVCTPPSTHFALGAQCLRSGAHLLCEKPLAPQHDQACELVALAKECGVSLMTSAKFRFVPAVQRARQMLTGGVIGDLRRLHINFCNPIDLAGRWNVDRSISGGGVLMDNGPHAVDLARYLVGELTLVRADFSASSGRYAVEDSAEIELRSATGTIVGITLSWERDCPDEWYAELQGTEGVLKLGWGRSRLECGQDVTEWGGYDKWAAFAGQLECFLGRCGGVTSAADGAAAVELIEAGYRFGGR